VDLYLTAQSYFPDYSNFNGLLSLKYIHIHGEASKDYKLKIVKFNSPFL
jgi:hypothetical protein